MNDAMFHNMHVKIRQALKMMEHEIMEYRLLLCNSLGYGAVQYFLPCAETQSVVAGLRRGELNVVVSWIRV